LCLAERENWQPHKDFGVMNILDLTKATLFCGIAAFLIYTFPTLAQGLIIGLLSLLWLAYLRQVIIRLRRG